MLYGSGLRLMECFGLRVKDVDISVKQIIVRNGKGFKDRVTVLSETVVSALNEHRIRVKALHKDFLSRGYGEVELPYALARKYPNAKYEWGWQYVFPSMLVYPCTNADILLRLTWKSSFCIPSLYTHSLFRA